MLKSSIEKFMKFESALLIFVVSLLFFSVAVDEMTLAFIFRTLTALALVFILIKYELVEAAVQWWKAKEVVDDPTNEGGSTNEQRSSSKSEAVVEERAADSGSSA